MTALNGAHHTMSILQAALSTSVFSAAQQYLASGVSVIPLKGKLCALKSWSMAQQYRASDKVLAQWKAAGLLAGVGIVCGAVSGNLVVLDFDSHDAVAEFRDEFPLLQDTLIVSSGSRRGAHYYYVSVHNHPTLLVKNYELRSNGAYVVAPPSPHPSGNLYEVSQALEPMHVPDMHAVVRWIKSKRPQQPPAPTQPTRPTAAHTGGSLSREAYFKKRYIDTALTAQIDMVATSTEGNRNTQLFRSALVLGGFVSVGAVARAWLENELLIAARCAGLPDNESVATIRSGIDAGEKNPRHIPGPPAPKSGSYGRHNR